MQTGQRVAATGMLVSGALAVIKIAAGMSGHSTAVVADGLESAADVIASGFVLFGLTLAAKPADDNHPYGHGRAETLTGLLIGSRNDTATTVVGFSLACLVGGSAYASAFVALSVFTSRALLLGLAYTLIWEGVLSGLLEGTRFLSIRQATLGLAAALGVKVPGDPLVPSISIIVLGTVLIGAFLLASRRLARFEIRGGD